MLDLNPAMQEGEPRMDLEGTSAVIAITPSLDGPDILTSEWGQPNENGPTVFRLSPFV